MSKRKRKFTKKIALIGKEINRVKQKASLIKIKFEKFEIKNQKSNRAYEVFKKNLKLRKSEEKKRENTFGNDNKKNKSAQKLLITEQNIENLMETIELFDNDEKEKLTEFYEGNYEKLENFLKNVSRIEKYKKNTEKAIENKKKEQENKINEVSEQIKYKDILNSDKENQIRYLESQIKEYKNSKQILETKLNSVVNLLNQTNIKVREKEKMCTDLFDEINSLKKVLEEKQYDPSNIEKMQESLGKEETTTEPEKSKISNNSDVNNSQNNYNSETGDNNNTESEVHSDD